MGEECIFSNRIFLHNILSHFTRFDFPQPVVEFILIYNQHNHHHHLRSCATRKKPPPWLSTMALECARRDSPGMTLPAPSSLPSSADPNTRASWSAWATRTAT